MPKFLMAQEIDFSVSSGFFDNEFSVELTSDFSGDIRYTLNGTNPTLESPIYNQPILVQERNSEPNTISNIPTNSPTSDSLFVWKPPMATIPKARIIKAALFNNGIQISNLFFEEYFIGTPLSEIALPIFSIQLDSFDLFDYEAGIYVPGKHFDNNPNAFKPGNYYEEGEEWEKVMSLSFYKNQTFIFRQKTEMEMHGSFSRRLPCKSIRLSAKTSLGNEYFEYPFFEDRDWTNYKRILLRNSGNDWNRSLFADVLLHTLLKEQEIEYQASLQVVVFINGAYWGIHNLREKYDKYYFGNYHEGDLEAIDYMEIIMEFLVKEGSTIDYEMMNESLSTLDLQKQSDYEIISKQIDIANFIDHHISKVYGGGNDWSGNNERIWRTHETESRWRWIGNDYDDTFREVGKDSYAHATRSIGEDYPNPAWSTRLYRSLMTNNSFAKQYKNRLRFLLDNIYSTENVIRVIDSIASIYRPEMPRQIERWNYPTSIEDWEQTIEDFKLFAKQRPENVWDNFLYFFPNIYTNPLEIKFAPNPAKDFIFIDLPESSADNFQIQIFSIDGKKMSDGFLSNEKQNEIKLSDWSNGIYVLSIFNGDEYYTWKFMIQR